MPGPMCCCGLSLDRRRKSCAWRFRGCGGVLIFALSSLAVDWTGSAKKLQGRCPSAASIAGFIRLTGPNSRPSSASVVRKGAARAAVDPTAVWSTILVMGAGGTRTTGSGGQAEADLCGGCQYPLSCPLPSPGIRRKWSWPAPTSTMIRPRMGRGT
jgi:hypothetical protein